MEAIIAVAAVILVGIQAHRNYLMIQAAKRVQADPIINITVEPNEICYASLAKAMEESWPNVTVSNDVTLDYERLAEAIVNALPRPEPYYPIPMPQYPTYEPIISDGTGNINVADDGHFTVNDIEINGVKARQFPAR